MKEMAIHSSILAWEIPWTEKPGNPQSHKESDMTLHLNNSNNYGVLNLNHKDKYHTAITDKNSTKLK